MLGCALGVTVFRVLFAKLTGSFQKLEPDFHGWISVAFDGSTGTMPDTRSQCCSIPQAADRAVEQPPFHNCG